MRLYFITTQIVKFYDRYKTQYIYLHSMHLTNVHSWWDTFFLYCRNECLYQSCHSKLNTVLCRKIFHHLYWTSYLTQIKNRKLIFLNWAFSNCICVLWSILHKTKWKIICIYRMTTKVVHKYEYQSIKINYIVNI